MNDLLFISDLHLSAKTPKITSLFLRFLEQRAVIAKTLYILGDLFDAWIGDDDTDPPNLEIIQALKKLTATVDVFIIVGNRDFLLGADFAKASGVSLLADKVSFDFFGKHTLLMHGDQLCTDDVQYQKARQQLRHPDMIKQLLMKSLTERRALADQYRQMSGEATSLLADDIMDVNTQKVADEMSAYHAEWLIHGHTHRQDIHLLENNQQRIVLGAWTEQQGSVFVINQTQAYFESVL
jgi:UDP-2,3-diacylglucosamine hydrolase